MRIPSVTIIAGLLAAFAAQAQSQEQNQPPKGFTAVFNGKDLTGWHGLNLSQKLNPMKFKAMSETERAEKLAKDTADAKQHWSVQNGELVNDGNGAYLTTDKEFSDIELL